MVKRHNKTGRRQILQLEDKKAVPAPSSKPPSRSIIHYSDSDDDDDSKKSGEFEPSVSSASEKQKSLSAPLDSQVADFLKEIDAMTTKEQAENDSSEAESSQASNLVQKKSNDTASIRGDESKNVQSSKEGSQPVASSEGVYCAWQEICDDSTGYSYYWNMHTNEVTWECPLEYLQYINYMNSAAQGPSSSEKATQQLPSQSNDVQKRQKKKEPQKLTEGAIIPISYFGGSSSSDNSSDSDNEISKPLKTDKKLKENDKNLSSKKSHAKIETKVNSSKKQLTDTIGPQLPPDFHFSDTIGPQLPSDFHLSDTIGPQLPSDFQPPETTGAEVVPDCQLSETIGPQLPPDFQLSDPTEPLPLSDSQFPETPCITSSVDNAESIKSEDNNFVEFGPQLAPDCFVPEISEAQSADSNSDICLTEAPKDGVLPHDNNDINLVEQDSSQSNGISSAESSQHEPSWQESLLNIEREFKGSNKNTIEGIPDSTTRKDGSFSTNRTSSPCQTSNGICVFRPVVEYDNFTDEDDEIDSEIISSSRNENVDRKEVTKPIQNSNQDIDFHCIPNTSELKQVDQNLPESQSEPSCSTVVPEKIPEVEEYFEPESSNCNELNSKDDPIGVDSLNSFEQVCLKDIQMKPQSKDNFSQSESASPSESNSKKSGPIDIDSLFAAQSTSGKFGFGFSRQKQLQIENENLCSNSSQSYRSVKSRNNYPSISFVKSNQVLDLTVLNKDLIFQDNKAVDEKKQVLVENNLKHYESNSLNSDADTSSVNESDSTFSSNGLLPVKTKASKSEISTSVASEDILKTIKKGIASKRKKKNALSDKRDVNSALAMCSSMDMEIDEIDKALCDALEEKKTSDLKLSKPSTSAQIHLEEQSVNEAEVNISLKKIKTDNGMFPDDSTFMATIIDLSSLLVDKLSFLLANQTNLTTMSGFLIQLQTRLMDWQGGALESKYFMARLQEVHNYLQHYERSIVSGEWTCQWDRENKRYFYVNGRTQHSQWTFPGEVQAQEKPPWINSSEIATSSASNFQMTGTQFPLVSSSMTEQRHKRPMEQHPSSSSKYISRASPPPPPPGVDSPPPPPPQTPPPESPPPPPPDSTEREVEAPQDMDLENSNSSDSTLFTLKPDTNPIQMTTQFPSQFALECTSTRSPEHFLRTSTSAVSSTSQAFSDRPSVITRPPQPVTTSIAVSDIPFWLQTSACSSTQSPVMPSDIGNGAEIEEPAPSVSNLTSGAIERNNLCIDGSIPSTSGTALHRNQQSKATTSTSISAPGLIPKKEKKKTKLLAGLALKKKNIQSLVQKWQKIKEEQEKEDKNSDEAKISTSM